MATVTTETPIVELVCQPHGKDNLFGHVWSSSADDAPCKCAMAVTWAMLGVRSIAKTSAPRLPPDLPIASANLPASYERAKAALAECQAIDECKTWADKAAALASYARQAADQTLHHYAVRISSRAIRRCGELLETFQSPGGRPSKTSGGAPTSFSQRQAAEAAGMSKDQEVQAVRVANVPSDEFEAAVESDNPPTVTALAEMGTTKQPAKEVPPKFAEATHVLGVLQTFARFCEEHDPIGVAKALYVHEVDPSLRQIATIERWLSRFVRELKEEGRC